MGFLAGLFPLLHVTIPAVAAPKGLAIANRVRITHLVVGTAPRRGVLVDRLTLGWLDHRDPDHLARRSLEARTVEAIVRVPANLGATTGLPAARLLLTLEDRDFDELPTGSLVRAGGRYSIRYGVRARLVVPRWYGRGRITPETRLEFTASRRVGDSGFTRARLTAVDGDSVGDDREAALGRAIERMWIARADRDCAKRLGPTTSRRPKQ